MEPAWTMTDPFHRAPYPTISPLRPELSQAGRTMLVTGGNEGIGFAIAKAFEQANAARVIILGRRAEATKNSAAQIAQQYPRVEVQGLTCDISKSADIDELWASLGRQAIVVDILVLNAVVISESKPILATISSGKLWQDFDTNVKAQLQMIEHFHAQDKVAAKGANQKVFINVSSYAIHEWKVAAEKPGYGLTKSAATLAIQLIAQDVPPEEMQIVSMNPGGVFTRAAKAAGYTEESFQWNHPDLPGQFALWLASSEAKFLHGRFVWAEWDVDQLKSGVLRKKIDEDSYHFKVGVRGL
ncbi:hypothetical protein FNYG_15906 [Fusarium nygamai]|uniref:Uncharacterized protein n=1 Tax=Gibberella nygamai TaxID=42673 RepID=A0A2K0U0F0_GIBNY|nr:hypothetical protein FNYG_15906 [Fusarium nygamai]